MRWWRKQGGVASVELAFLLIPLVLLTFGTAEFGRAVYQFNTLAKASRDAARFLSGQGPGDATDLATAKCLAVYGNTDCTGNALVPGLTTDMVSVCDSVSCPDHKNYPIINSSGSSIGVINLVTVTISGYKFDLLVPYVAELLNMSTPQITFNPISTTMRQIL